MKGASGFLSESSNAENLPLPYMIKYCTLNPYKLPIACSSQLESPSEAKLLIGSEEFNVDNKYVCYKVKIMLATQLF